MDNRWSWRTSARSKIKSCRRPNVLSLSFADVAWPHGKVMLHLTGRVLVTTSNDWSRTICLDTSSGRKHWGYPVEKRSDLHGHELRNLLRTVAQVANEHRASLIQR